MMQTRSQSCKGGLPRGSPLASPGANPPSAVSRPANEVVGEVNFGSDGNPPNETSSSRHGMVLRSRQGNAGVTLGHDHGSGSTSVAAGSGTSNFKVKKCKHPLCKTCPFLVTETSFVSSVTKRTYLCVNHTKEKIHCHSQNYIYLLSCSNCGYQIVGESIVQLNLRMNIYRTAEEGCEEFIHHFSNNCPNATFSIQIIEKLKGTGYLQNGDIDEDMRSYRLEREDFWIKTLRTIFPYGLNDKAKRKNWNPNNIIGNLFHKLPRYGDRSSRVRRTGVGRVEINKDRFFEEFHRRANVDILNCANWLRIT